MPSKGRPEIHLRLDPEILAALRIEAKLHRLKPVDLVRILVEAYIKGGTARAVPLPYPLGEETLRKAVMAQLRGLLGQLRFEIASVDVPRIRKKRVKDLSQAIDDLSTLSKAAGPEHRFRIYQLLGYLCMVLDGVLNNVTKGELLQRLERVEERMDVQLEESREAGETDRRKDSVNT